MAQPLRKEEPHLQVSTSEGRPMVIARDLPAFQSYRLLHAGYVAVPIVAGVDKFSNVLVDWTQYLAPEIPSMLGISPRSFMFGVGVIEIAAGIGVLLKPRIFGYVVSAWLLGIVGNLILKRKYLDVALRDLGLAVGAAALGRISSQFEVRKTDS